MTLSLEQGFVLGRLHSHPTANWEVVVVTNGNTGKRNRRDPTKQTQRLVKYQSLIFKFEVKRIKYKVAKLRSAH